MSKPLIRVVGSLNIDFTTVTPRLPGPGETLLATSHTISPGGKGANQAVACGRASITERPPPAPSRSSEPNAESKAHADIVDAMLSEHQDVSVEMVGAVGKNDPYWTTMLRPTLTKSGVSTRLVREVAGVGGTGTATIIVDEATGENRILVVGGANQAGMVMEADPNADEDDINTQTWNGIMAPQPNAPLEADGKGGKKLPLPHVVVLQGEIPRETVMETIRSLGNLSVGVEIVFNPAPVFAEGIAEGAWDCIGHLIVNETEAEMLLESLADSSSLDEDTEEAIKSLASSPHGRKISGKEDFDRISALFHDRGVKVFIITLGAEGVYYSQNESRSPEDKVQDRIRSGMIPAVKVAKVVDTTAAGDTFVGRYATELARWKWKTAKTAGAGPGAGASSAAWDFDVEGAVYKANGAAAKCVQRRGAMESIPWGWELD